MPYIKDYEETLYNRDWLYQKYVVEDRNAAQVAALAGCRYASTVLDRLRRCGIAVKDQSAAQKVREFVGGSPVPRPRRRPEGCRQVRLRTPLIAGCSNTSQDQPRKEVPVQDAPQAWLWAD